MDPLVIFQFTLATLMPVVASVALTLLMRRTKLGEASYWRWQISCGLIFGAIAIFGTEMGIDYNGATMNVRDAAPVVAGLYFGGPAGIIAGIIGGVERWFAALWGRGMFTRVGCSAATIFAGLYAAAMNRYLFRQRKASWPLAMAIGMVAEVLHLLLVYLTNMDNAAHAYAVVNACTLPMVVCNGISAGLSGMGVTVASGQSILIPKKHLRDISQRMQQRMLLAILIVLVATLGPTALIANSNARNETATQLELALGDVEADLLDASDADLLERARAAASIIGSIQDFDTELIDDIVYVLCVSELVLVNSDGIIVASNNPKYIGYNMASGEQSAEFLELLSENGRTAMVQQYRASSIDRDMLRKFAGCKVEDGFVQVSYDQNNLTEDFKERLQTAVANTHVGRNGHIMVFSADGDLVGSRSDISISDSSAKDLFDVAGKHENGEVFKTTFLGVAYYAMCVSLEGIRLVALLPQDEANLSRDSSILVSTYMEIIIFFTIFVAIYILMEQLVVRNIWRVNGRLGQITQGDLEVKVDVRDSTEFASLSDDINSTVAALRDAIEAEKTRIDRELGYARDIQLSALQTVFPAYPDHDDFDLYASMHAAKEVGGDFYDFYLLDDDHLAFLIADVSGKGIPAALFMMRAKTSFRSFIDTGYDVGEVFEQVNNLLCEGNDTDMFVTAWMGIIDLTNGHVRFANAGHNPPAVRHGSGPYELMDMRKNIFLAYMENMKYQVNEIDLKPGDVIFIYTDGVVEANNLDEDLYGNDRLLAALNGADEDCSMKQLCVAVRNDVNEFANEMPQFDDMTMLALRYNGR